MPRNKMKKDTGKNGREKLNSALKIKPTTTTTTKRAKVLKVAKIAKAAAHLTAKLTNPYNVSKMLIDAGRGKGLVLPGSRYIGPGNSMNAGEPLSSADRAARLHDMDYDRLLNKGVKAKKLYLGYSRADERLMSRSDVTTYDGLATYSGMGAKKLGYKAGLSGNMIED